MTVNRTTLDKAFNLTLRQWLRAHDMPTDADAYEGGIARVELVERIRRVLKRYEPDRKIGAKEGDTQA